MKGCHKEFKKKHHVCDKLEITWSRDYSCRFSDVDVRDGGGGGAKKVICSTKYS